MNKNRIIAAVIAIVMLLLFVIPFALLRSGLKNPILYDGIGNLRFMWLGFVIALLISIIILCLLRSGKKRNVALIALSIIYVIVYVCPLTILAIENNAQILFPLASVTNDASEYHNFDRLNSSAVNETLDVMFPKKIPDGAKNVEYEYFYNPGDLSTKVRLKFSANQEVLDTLKSQIKTDGLKTDIDGTHEAYYSDDDTEYMHISFEHGTVEYLYLDLMASSDAKFGNLLYDPNRDTPIN